MAGLIAGMGGTDEVRSQGEEEEQGRGEEQGEGRARPCAEQLYYPLPLPLLLLLTRSWPRTRSLR